MKRPLVALVLAAGQGIRFRSGTTKILHPLLGRSMLKLVCEAVACLKPAKTAIVVGHQREAVMEEALLLRVGFIHQDGPNGTADAVLAARNWLRESGDSDVLIIPADLPLVRPEALRALVRAHRRRENAVSVFSAKVEDPICIFKTTELLRALSKSGRKCGAGEFKLAEVLDVLSAAGKKVAAVEIPDDGDFVQVRTRLDLSRAIRILRERKICEVSEAGVTILNPVSTWIDIDVSIGRDTTIYPSVILEGRTTVGAGCRIYPNVHVINCRIGDRVSVFSSTVMEDVTVEDEVTIGPFARLRPKTFLRAGSHVGNFVEMKNTDFGRKSKAGHLSYLGDAEIQEGVNVGAGTITCNYDGVRKNRTIIEAGAFIGSGTELVAPVRVGRGAYVAAGSVITKDVSPDALAVARGRQFEKADWARRKRETRKSNKQPR